MPKLNRAHQYRQLAKRWHRAYFRLKKKILLVWSVLKGCPICRSLQIAQLWSTSKESLYNAKESYSAWGALFLQETIALSHYHWKVLGHFISTEKLNITDLSCLVWRGVLSPSPWSRLALSNHLPQSFIGILIWFKFAADPEVCIYQLPVCVMLMQWT